MDVENDPRIAVEEERERENLNEEGGQNNLRATLRRRFRRVQRRARRAQRRRLREDGNW